jgi:intracellular sulfur oxidation DsrE/DsrF family protein
MKYLLLLLAMTFCFSTHADLSSFHDGPLIKEFGKHAKVKQDLKLNSKQVLKVAFDVAKQGSEDSLNRSFDSLARFLNMHVANGFKAENVQLALVVHGSAAHDLLNNKAYQKKFSKNNPNYELLTQLIQNNVRVYLCGQSASYYEINNESLHHGANMALSAMTAHAVLQQQGYSLNPF